MPPSLAARTRSLGRPSRLARAPLSLGPCMYGSRVARAFRGLQASGRVRPCIRRLSAAVAARPDESPHGCPGSRSMARARSAPVRTGYPDSLSVRWPSSHLAPHHLVRNRLVPGGSVSARRVVAGSVSQQGPDGSRHAVCQGDCGLLGGFALQEPPQPVLPRLAAPPDRDHAHCSEIE